MKLIDGDPLTNIFYDRLDLITKRYGADSAVAGAVSGAIKLVQAQPEAIVRCKDCKHRPTGDQYKHDLEFPDSDYKCPCRCEDHWYSWMPDDNWYCANGERKTDDR